MVCHGSGVVCEGGGGGEGRGTVVGALVGGGACKSGVGGCRNWVAILLPPNVYFNWSLAFEVVFQSFSDLI